ncbi:P-II family nitrogen regulator [Pelotomaculum terephthalicicum JT]|uniref:P-II family nitrogen regulator n=1 Tax=Pelotomaculum TaxID=191373 RepID=UPI0009CE5726|nr:MULTISPECIES: P-II family nitrogen regulator [Pelotomaculum]MCG9969728.1 P-II family nitrogen regulator [Pelotomaculum terephthalicicum JT]OPX91316.1 MAG: Nitrogen regulatory protein P-II [Pelotomaculum sp. PtaB.Bin117]OPX91319.1 MAG: Nitrogen regulatory protein P-II [Pelotomaculum sp. PtaB.Bin117]
MTKIECILRPGKLEDVKEAVNKYGIHGMTVTQVIGCGLQKGRTEVYRGAEYSINLLPKIKLEMVIPDEDVAEVLKIITNVARTGEIGDGKIFTYKIDNAIRIRTGEKGDEAI